MTEKKIKIGDTVEWRGAFGMQEPKPAKVIGMEVTEWPRDKYGETVEEADWKLVQQNRVLFTLDNGHWAYSEQIKPLTRI